MCSRGAFLRLIKTGFLRISLKTGKLSKNIIHRSKRLYMGDKDGLYKIEEKKVVDSVDIKTAVIYRLNDLIKQKDITVNEAAVRSGVPPSTLKNILYGQSRNAGVVTIKKICDGLDITIQEFFEDPIFADLEPEL